MGPCIEILSSLLVKSLVSCGKTWMGVSLFPHISSLLSPKIPLCDGRWKVKWSFFFTTLLLSYFSKGPGLWQHKLLLHPSSSRDLQTHTDPPCTPAHTSNLLVDSAGWKGLKWVCGQPQAYLSLGRGEETGGMKRRKSRGSGTLCSTKNWARAAQRKTQSDMRLSMPNNFSIP